MVVCCGLAFIGESQQVFAIFVFAHWLCYFLESLSCYPSFLVCNFFEASYLKALTLLNDFNECACFRQTVVCSGIEPCKTALQSLYFQVVMFQIFLIYCCDFELSSLAWLYCFGNVHDAVGVEIESNNSVIALRMFGFFLDTEAIAVAVKLGNAITLRVVDVITEYSSVAILLGIEHTLMQKL